MGDSGNSSTLRVEHQSSQSATTSEFNSIAKTLNFNLPVKLDRDNYIHWKAQVLPAIQEYELDEFISGLQSIPPQYIEASSTAGVIERVENKQYKQWMKSDKLLLCWLYSTVHPSIIGEITNYVTSYEVWNVLENLFAQQSMVKVLQLKQELQNITKGSMQISDFVLKVKSLGDGLKAAGEMIKDQDLVLHILNGIGHDYDPVAVLISSQKQSMSLQEVHYLLMIHEQRLAHLNSSSYVNVPAPSANYIAGNQGHRQGQRGNGGSTNGRGGGRDRGRGRGRYNNNGKPVCQICGKGGHSAMFCYNRFDRAYVKNNQNYSTNNSHPFQQQSSSVREEIHHFFKDPMPLSFRHM
ncbi:hypothetical protein ACOSQ4_004034 [Xanthoceras sorbifolium]